MSYGGQRQAWAKINRNIKLPEAEDEINEIAEEIEQKLKDNGSERYFDFSADCTLLMNRTAEWVLHHAFSTLETSEADESMQDFAYNILVNRAKFEKLVIKYIEQKAKEQELAFTIFFLRYHGTNYHAMMEDDNDKPILKVRDQETPVLKRYVMKQILFRFDKYDFDQLSDEELDILVEDIRQNFEDMKSYTRYELITFMHGREISLSPPDNGDGDEIAIEYPADETWSPTCNDITYLAQIFQQFLKSKNESKSTAKKKRSKKSDTKPPLTLEELQRAFVSSICGYKGDYAVIIRQAAWMTKQEQENMIRFMDRYCMEKGTMPTVKALAEHLGIYTSDSAFSKAKDKLKTLLEKHPDVTYGCPNAEGNPGK